MFTLAKLMADLKQVATDHPELLDQQVLIVNSNSFTPLLADGSGYYRETHGLSGCVVNGTTNVLMIKFDD